MPGGRELLLYGRRAHDAPPLPALPPESPATAPHLRRHPFRGEWVAYAGARQGRTFLPDQAACPLCPAGDGRLGEIPFSEFEIAVFENRFPALIAGKSGPSDIAGIAVAPAEGRCEVVVFSADHAGGLGTLPVDRLALLIEVWGARLRALRDEAGFAFVLPFENRGEEIGVTLHHPHGQIYAFAFVPQLVLRAAKVQQDSPVVAHLIDAMPRELLLDAEDAAVSFVPPFAMYPFETWLAPRRRVAGPDELSPAETEVLARLLRRAI